ncbi:MAG: ribose 5-phosphate isomerase B [Prevotellaceae bacterium]|jgi:ribose 5-phosphate isomerase B|nr:ribose 5-phosphate isomerase B [Prevotellaceae bacterium]
MKIGLASDHAGYEMKQFLLGMLEALGHEVVDFGTNSKDSVDYPDFAHPLAEAVVAKKVEIGIAMCGTGNGVNMAVNRHKGVRGVLCWSIDIGRLTRQHNGANICCLPARFISNLEAAAIVESFLSTPFEGGRHQKRIEKIEC